MPPRTVLFAVHTTTSGRTEYILGKQSSEKTLSRTLLYLAYHADERRWIMPAGHRQPAGAVYALARLVSWRVRPPEMTRTHARPRIRARTALLAERESMTAHVSYQFIPPYCVSSSSGGGNVECAGAVGRVGGEQKQQQQSKNGGWWWC